MNVNTLAKIAKNYGIENSNSLRDGIVSEYTNTLNSLNTIEESVIVKDISVLPVYKIEEYGMGFGFSPDPGMDAAIFSQVVIEPQFQQMVNNSQNKEVFDYLWITSRNSRKIDKSKLNKNYPSKNEYKKALLITNKILNKYSELKTAITLVDNNYTIDDTLDNGVIIFYIDTGRIDNNKKYNRIIESFKKEIRKELKKNNIILNSYKESKSIETVFINKPRSHKIEEGYAIDLDSLKYVVESENITLEEAVQKIRDANYIGDTYPMYCVLREGFNEKMSIDNFNTLYKSLIKSGITPITEKSGLKYKDFKDVGKN